MPWPKGRPFPPGATAKRVATMRANAKRAKKPRTVDGVAHWFCPACERWLPAADFYADKRTPNGLKSNCKRCHLRTAVATRDPERKADTNREHMARARQASPEKFRERERLASTERPRGERARARDLLNRAVRRGVEWLCSKCHGLEHRTFRRLP